MSLFQLIALVFGLWMAYEAYLYRKKKVLSGIDVSVWITLWLLFIAIALFPNLLLGITQRLNFARVFDLLVVAAMMVLTVVVFLNYFAQKETRSRVEKLVQELAITNVSKPQAKKLPSQRKAHRGR